MNVTRTAVAVIIGVAMMAGVGLATMSFPLIRLPTPTGTYSIGTLDGALVGAIPVKFWYPARETSGARRATYRPEVERKDRTILQRIIFPLVRPAAYEDLPVAGGRHALVLYIPGWGDKRSDNTALCEDLASHGFVVAAIDDQVPHPAMDFSSARAAEQTLRWANAKVDVQALRVRTVLATLQRFVPADHAYRVTSTIDFSRVAALGFSFGGATAAEAAVRDSRIRAAVNLDGWTFGAAARHGVGKPFMIVSTGAENVDPTTTTTSDADGRGPYEINWDRKNLQLVLDGFRRHGGYLVTIDGSRHENFCDAALVSLKMPTTGAIDGRRATRIVVAYVNEFLSLVLDGRPAPLLTHPLGTGPATSRSSLDEAAELTTWVSPPSTRESN